MSDLKVAIGDILLIESNQLAGMPAMLEVQVDEILYGDSPNTTGILLAYSAKILSSNRSWLVMPEDIICRYSIH